MKLLILDATPAVERLADRFEGDRVYQVERVADAAALEQSLSMGGACILLSSLSSPERVTELQRVLEHPRAEELSAVLLLEQASQLDQMKDVYDAGFDDFVVEPVQTDVLFQRVEHMRRRRIGSTSGRITNIDLKDWIFEVDRSGVIKGYQGSKMGPFAVTSVQRNVTNITAMVPEAVGRRLRGAMEHAFDTHKPGMIECRIATPQGSSDYEVRIVPRDGDEAVLLISDVTERKVSDARLRTEAEIKRAFTTRIIKADEASRLNLSRELHDGIGQMMLVHRMDAEWLVSHCEPGPLKEAAERLCSALDSTLESVRNLAMDLRPPAIDDLGISSALETLTINLSRRSGIPVDLEADSYRMKFPNNVSVAIYRIAQEALTNALRHSQCTRIKVQLGQADNNLELRVIDDGIGFDTVQESGSETLGLVGMRERAVSVAGHFSIESSPNTGTCVKVVVPGMLGSAV